MRELLFVLLMLAMFGYGWLVVREIGERIDYVRHIVRRSRRKSMLLLESPPQMSYRPFPTLLAALLRLTDK